MHVVVCGAGVIGLFCAHYLRAQGHEVTVLDRKSRAEEGCSFGNCGMIVPSHLEPLASPGAVGLALRSMFDSSSPLYLRPRLDAGFLGWALRFARAANARHAARSAPLLRDLHLASRRLYGELTAETGNEFGLVTRGLLTLCRTARGLEIEARAAAHANALGIPAEVLSAHGAAQLDPGVNMNIAGAVFYPLDCHLTSPRLMATLLALGERAGVKFRWSSQVTGWRVAGSRIAAVRTPHGELEADAFVLAAGSWSAAMVRGLRLTLPLQPGKGYSVTLRRPRELPQLCSVLSEARVAVTPMGDSLRIGGTMEFSGFRAPPRAERVERIIEAAVRYFPALRPADFQGVEPWSGLRPCSPDGLPYIGRFARYPNLCAATGHAMMGVSLGPITGRLVSEVLAGQAPSIALDALAPDRYG